MDFYLSTNTRFHHTRPEASVANAISILERDIKKCLIPDDSPETVIELASVTGLKTECYQISIPDEHHLSIHAGDELGFVYGLLYLSQEYLDVQPFWFWMDQQILPKKTVAIPVGTEIASPVPAVRFRGWFLNDEVLLIHWHNGKPEDFPWHMAFEALLRCGGNMVIPGTDKASRQYEGLASHYGLWLTHHHAQPLGAEIFARAYPDLAPSWFQNPECFKKLWEDAVIRQKDENVIWTLGFRGQGDCPFWESKGDEVFTTPEARGKVISDLIELQRQIVCKHIEHPVFCTNLYGEVMELYNQGHIHLHPDIIKVWADNGYGHMCTRRQDNHDARVCSLPHNGDAGPHGVYYHISFHDLQAASHMTTLPNTVDFVNRELKEAYAAGIQDYWIINSSNIRPHAYYLDAIKKLWYGETVSDASQSRQFADTYYHGSDQAAQCLDNYARSLLQYGPFEDQHAGEQFYNYAVRHMARQFIIDRNASSRPLYWLTGDVVLWKQAEKILQIHEQGAPAIAAYYKQCQAASASIQDPEVKRLFDTTILLQATIHHFCCQGAILFCRGLLEFQAERYQESFFLLGQAAEFFTNANQFMRNCEYDVWKGFYENDCLTDIKFTAYVIWSVMHVVRVIGDDTRMADWYEDFVRPKADRKVRLLAITQSHMTDEELLEAMKKDASMTRLIP